MPNQHPARQILFLCILFSLACKFSMADRAVTINIDDTKCFQTMDGFGASLTDSSAWLISKSMKPDQREKLKLKSVMEKTVLPPLPQPLKKM